MDDPKQFFKVVALSLWQLGKDFAAGFALAAGTLVLALSWPFRWAYRKMNPEPEFWAAHRRVPVRCKFMPRHELDGRPVKPELMQHYGKEIELVAYWRMGMGDPVPGEWALGVPGYYGAFGCSWIASGDVLVVEEE